MTGSCKPSSPGERPRGVEESRLVFLGSGPFAVPALETLTGSKGRPALVVTRPDRPGGRGRKPRPTPVRERAESLGLDLEAPPSANEPGFLGRLKALAPDIIIVSDYGEILRPPLLELPRVGSFNLHASLLPRHRGAAPVVAALLEGDPETGVTLFRITPGLDEGPMVDRVATPISPEETAGELEARLARLAAELLLRNLPRLASGQFTEEPQDESRATRAPKLPRGAGGIDWSMSVASLVNFIRALSPRPGAHSYLTPEASGPGRQDERIRFLRARLAPGPAIHLPPGTISSVEKHGFRVAAGGGAIEVLELQEAGGPALTASAFLQGHPLRKGDRFHSSHP